MRQFLKKLVLYTLLVILINMVFSFFYEMPIRESIANKTHSKYVKFNDIHGSANTFDIIFLGSSRGYCAYNPLVFDSILNTRSYNMCTGSQNTVESFYILQDILENQQPKYVVYEMFLPSLEERNDFYHMLSNADFFNSYTLKAEMIIKGFGIEGLLNYFTPIIRHKEYIKQKIEKLFSSEVVENKENWISGYLYNEGVIDSASIAELETIKPFTSKYLSNRKIDYFKQLAELCDQKNIELVCIRSPYPPSRSKIGGEDATSEFLQSLCEGQNVKFIDLNRIDNSNFQYKDTDFSDAHHMNIRGAAKVSKQLAIILKKH